MLRPRVIPCLLVHKGGLVKTVRFSEPKYVGDPINAVRIFNEKEVDELMVVDIDATVRNAEPDYEMIEHLAAECRMPLCYGGGIRTLAQIEKIIGLGVEKVSLSSVCIENPDIIRQACASVGSQSVVAVLDVKQVAGGSYRVFTHNGTRATDRDPVSLAGDLEALGIGEIIVNAIDADGRMNGYDLDLVRLMRPNVHTPMTILGGAGSLDDMEAVIREHGAMGVAAGSLFVFKGIYRAVLINYPTRSRKDEMFERAMAGQ
jgi:cyclase